jgi:hypothetical protein
VCAKLNAQCVGYTNFSNDVCKKFHPNATSIESVNGSKAGFYCNGAPQKGLACETMKNTCQVCPACNVNADCNTQIGDQFREMYVECVGRDVATTTAKTKWSIAFRDWLNKLLSSLRTRLGEVLIKKTVTVVVPGGDFDENIGIHPDQVICEFYQHNKKHVTCGAYKAADTFCTQVMQSRFARALKCEENGLVVCGNPCNPPEYQVPIKQCAFDNDRPRGNQAPPISFCETTTTTTNIPPKGTKKPGEVCVHGGECTTGNCLGLASHLIKASNTSAHAIRSDLTIAVQNRK